MSNPLLVSLVLFTSLSVLLLVFLVVRVLKEEKEIVPVRGWDEKEPDIFPTHHSISTLFNLLPGVLIIVLILSVYLFEILR